VGAGLLSFWGQRVGGSVGVFAGAGGPQGVEPVHAEEAVGGFAGAVQVGVVEGDFVEAGVGRVTGFVAEGCGSQVGDGADLGEGFADVGLRGPVGELGHGDLELVGDVGEAGVVLEPGLEAELVLGGEGGCRERRGVGLLGRLRLMGFMGVMGFMGLWRQIAGCFGVGAGGVGVGPR
jgi:hypothetical protein